MICNESFAQDTDISVQENAFNGTLCMVITVCVFHIWFWLHLKPISQIVYELMIETMLKLLLFLSERSWSPFCICHGSSVKLKWYVQIHKLIE